MKKMLIALMSSLTFLMLLCSMAVPALATVSPAEAPEWEEGNRWAYGSESNVGSEFAEELEGLAETLETMTNGTVNELSLDGTVGFWTLVEVTEANDDEYVLSMTMAGKVALDASISVTAQLDKAGTYDWADEKETEEMDVVVDVGMDLVVIVEIDVTFDHDTMDMKSIAIDMEVDGAVDFVADNIPMSEDDWTNWTTTIWYEDFDVTGDLNLDLSFDLAFAPALNIWDFPIAVGEIWTVDSQATISGSLTGQLDVQGLPEDMMDEMFTEEFIEQTGFSDFPIVFEEMNGEDSPFQDGVMEEETQDIEMDLKCVSATVVDDDYWGEITVYKIAALDSPFEFFYSPDVGFMSYMAMDVEDLDEVMDMPLTISQEIRMDAVDPDVAADEINEIADFQGEVGGDSGVAGFFTEAPYLGLILIGVIVVVVVAAVLLMRKKK